MKWPTAIDLFAGAGGLTAGLRRARFRVLAAIEQDPLAAKSYRLNFPSVKVWEDDIRAVDPREVMDQLGLEPGELGLLAGCPPCQGFSTVRTRRKSTVRDKRNQLILEYLRFARALKPRALMMENVPGLSRYWLFRELRNELVTLGYEIDWKVRDAADFGVPQRRNRLILLGSNVGLPTWPSPEQRRRTVREVIRTLPPAGNSQDPLHDLSERRSKKVRSIIKRIPADGGSRRALGDDQLACHKRTNGFNDVYGRMAWDDVAPTITGGCVNPSKGRFLHPVEDRCITLREAALLQGLPPGFQLALDRGKFPAAQMVGNAIPPSLVAAHAAPLRDLVTSR